MAKVLMKGNEAIGAAAIKAGCKFFFGYPITPQNELPEYMSLELPKVGGVFVQAESEIAAINMVYGAASVGERVMTSSSSPGMALKQEGISYCAGAELPCVIVSIMRGGPGLGGIQPSQSDYYQSTRGGGNGDYRTLVYAPASIQETVDFVIDAFDKADFYRTPVLIAADGMIGQMMEAVEFTDRPKMPLPPKNWAAVGTKEKRKPVIINSLYLDPQQLENHNIHLEQKYREIEKNETLCETDGIENADVVCVAYGTTSRIVKNAIEGCRESGIKVGIIRPKTLWPFPSAEFEKINPAAKGLLTIEMSMGQMIDDVRLAVGDRFPLYFNGRCGGMIPTPASITADIKKIAGGNT